MTSLQDKFRGALVGALFGDCYGVPYQSHQLNPEAPAKIQKYFDSLENPDTQEDILEYTDDTAMTKSVAKALIHDADSTLYLAKLFSEEYFADPFRGYGPHIHSVFIKLRDTNFVDIYKPAKEQFNGSGSYGNGTGMRISPAGLYFYHNYDEMIKWVRETSSITHTNILGINGGILQAIAVHQALWLDPRDEFNVEQFCDQLIEKMKAVEGGRDTNLLNEIWNRVWSNSSSMYQNKLKEMKELLTRQATREEVVQKLGHGVPAHESVVTAIYCFLRAFENISDVKTDNQFRRTVQYALTLGGDTDTIGSMAAAIAGAYLGKEHINPTLANRCETLDEMCDLADKIYAKITPNA